MDSIWLPDVWQVLLGGAALALLIAVVSVTLLIYLGGFWIQAYTSDANVSMASLIVMSFLKLDHQAIVTAKIMLRQAGLPSERFGKISTAQFQAHDLAGGNLIGVVTAIVAAHRAGMDLDFDRACAIDLAGRDVLRAVQTSVSPQVIHCPTIDGAARTALSAVAKNGVELLVGVRVTVRTNLDQLVGGATEETVVARVGQAIITAIGSAESHMQVLERPSLISASAMANGLDQNTAFTIISIDISDIEVGENIGARLRTDQANADIRKARASAEVRRVEAVALEQEMRARTVDRHAALILAEAKLPTAIANALRAGNMRTNRRDSNPSHSPNSNLKIHNERSVS